jgi:putative salt-induced outer membrane protein YdiY
MELRTTQVLTVRPMRGAVVTGQMLLVNGKVTIYGEQTHTMTRDDILAVTAGLPRRSNYWSGEFAAGANYQSGNTDKETFNSQVMLMRRTVQRRLIFDYIGNYDETNGEEVENNHRFTANWDRFLTNRWFWSPMEFEYYKDKFLNIEHRISYGISLGYDLIDSDRTTWTASIGPAYTKTWFEAVAAGENDTEDSPAAKGRTRFDHELTGDIDLWYDYRFLFANEATGGYMHRMEAGATYEIIGDLDLRVSWIWDYISEPTENANGVTPDENDTQLQFGIGYTF